MGFRINTNIGALNAHANSVVNARELDKSLSRLSSGLRINSAADDASGMAIADSLRSQAATLGQAINNGNDAIGILLVNFCITFFSKCFCCIFRETILNKNDF